MNAILVYFHPFLKKVLSRKSLCLIFLFLGLSLTVTLGFWNDFDFWSMAALHRLGRHWWDCFIAFFSLLGSPEITGLAAMLIGYRFYRRLGPGVVLALLFAFGLGTFFEILGKLWIRQMPIPLEFGRHCYSFKGGTALHVPMPHTFPSGHTFRFVFVMLTAVVAWMDLQRAFFNMILGLAATLIGFMCVTRVYMGDHWASDVVGGIILAWLAFVWIPFGDKKRVE